MGAESRAGRVERLAWLGVALLTAAALALRLATLDFALPHFQEPDPHIVGQMQTLSQESVSDRDLFYTSIYPHLLARTAMALGDVTRRPAGIESFTLDEHLSAAGRIHLRVREVVAWLSVLIIPATWWIARRFVERRWALAAAALAATSTLALQFGQMARPHAAAAASIALSVAASLRLRRRGDAASFALAGAAAALAVACLTNGIAALLPAVVAYALREPRGRRPLDRWLDWRLAIPLALLALAIWRFYPFLFVARPPEAAASDGGGSIRLAWQTIDPADFAGRGFPTFFMTLWFYEPVALALAVVGLIAWFLRARDASPEARERRKDLLVVLSFALAYALAIGLYRRNQQRFVLPLVPFVAVLAAYGLRAIARAPRWGRLAIPLALAALAVPAAACLGYTRMRLAPHTLDQLAAWMRAHVDREHQRVGLHLLYDVPLARERGDLFAPDGSPQPVGFSPWLDYQRRWMSDVWKGERWNVASLCAERARWPWIAEHADEYLRSLEVDFVVLPGGDGVGINPLVRALREAAARAGEKVLELPRESRPPPSGLEGLDTPHFTAYVLTHRWFGPALDVYRLPRGG